MKKTSIVISSLLLSSSLLAQNSFDEAVKSGTLSGDVTLYGERHNNSGDDLDSGYTMGSIGLGYETGDFYGFKAEVGFRGNHNFSEVEENDYADGTEPRALLHTANLSYTNEYFGLKIGRQEIDLEWMSDFHESAVLSITAIPDTTIILGGTRRGATADNDGALESFSRFYTNENGYVLDAKYEGIKGLVINPYYYDADKLAKWYGLKVDYDTEFFGVTAHTAESELANSPEDGEIFHLEGRLNFEGLGIGLGYITTDDDQGVGRMNTFGDNINPFEEGNSVFEAGANTSYLNLNYEIAGVKLGAIYGETKYNSNKDKEFNFTLDYSITKNLSLGLLFADINVENKVEDSDYKIHSLTLEYSF